MIYVKLIDIKTAAIENSNKIWKDRLLRRKYKYIKYNKNCQIII